jgi:hypothetical protein
MFFFSRQSKNYRQIKHNLTHRGLLQSWINRCFKLQHEAAAFLQNKSEQMSLHSKRLIVIAFCLISFSTCLYQVIKSLIRTDSLTLSIAAIRVPEPVEQSANRHPTPAKGLFKDD